MEITPDIITQFGLMNKISTGHAMFDVLLCLLVPLLLKNIIPFLTDFVNKHFWKEKPIVNKFSRTVDHTQRTSYYWYDSDQGPPNTILQKALLNYINKQVDTLRELHGAELQLKKRPKPPPKLGNEGVEDLNDSQEHAYDVNVAPPVGAWIDLKNGIKFMRQQENLDDKQKNVKTSYILESDAKDGNAKIEAFVAEALELYKEQQTAKVDPSRYLYMPVLSMFRPRAEGDDAKAPSAIYKRYKLSEEKTFASFFHPEKDAIMHLVSQFVNKTGKFGIPGYPQKLGFLLHGPPGTGKTSFIKALAQHTNRSIISIPLTKISTNQELMDIMFDQRIQVENDSDSSLQLPYSKTIFVMEDVDAASTVVQRRTPASADRGTTLAEVAAIREAMAASAAASASKKKKSSGDNASRDGSEKNDQDDEDKDEKSDEEENETPTRGRRGGRSTDKASSSTATAISGPIGPQMPAGMSFGKLFKGDDELNLAGLLNVLDGVVDTPNRIVIMTTNHPEKLDPALIRPGRINRKVYMGRCKVAQALAMLQHYFGPVSESAQAQLQRIFLDDELSPAALEAMCAEFETTEELIQHLSEKFTVGGERS